MTRFCLLVPAIFAQDLQADLKDHLLLEDHEGQHDRVLKANNGCNTKKQKGLAVQHKARLQQNRKLVKLWEKNGPVPALCKSGYHTNPRISQFQALHAENSFAQAVVCEHGKFVALNFTSSKGRPTKSRRIWKLCKKDKIEKCSKNTVILSGRSGRPVDQNHYDIAQTFALEKDAKETWVKCKGNGRGNGKKDSICALKCIKYQNKLVLADAAQKENPCLEPIDGVNMPVFGTKGILARNLCKAGYDFDSDIFSNPDEDKVVCELHGLKLAKKGSKYTQSMHEYTQQGMCVKKCKLSDVPNLERYDFSDPSIDSSSEFTAPTVLSGTCAGTNSGIGQAQYFDMQCINGALEYVECGTQGDRR